MSGELILVVDDEPNIVSLSRMYLEREGFRVKLAADGEEALASVAQDKPALMVLDLMLPKIDGLEVCRRLRAGDHPILILMLTARDEVIDKVLGLEMGADDYLTKPFNPRELVARVKALLRRQKPVGKTQEAILHLGDLSIDRGARTVTLKGEAIQLRNQEFDLLNTLVAHQGLVLSREQLLEQAWGYGYAGGTRTVDVHIGHLRKKLTGSNVQVKTVTGIGYRLEVEG